MLDYNQGKIYKLYIGDLVYIGSTAQPRLSMRLGTHRSDYNKWVKNTKYARKYSTACELFKLGTPTIELIELFPCGSKDELNAREGFYQRTTNCVNKNIAGRKKAEYKEVHKEQISEYNKAYYKANVQQIGEQRKVCYAAKKQRIGEQNRAWRAAIKRTERLTLFIQKHIETSRHFLT
jgi:hypothetical protein